MTHMTVRSFKVVCVSGWFDPLHLGHIEYLKNAKLLGDKLVVILNHDAQRRPSVRLRYTNEQREMFVRSIRYVDDVVLSIDADAHVCASLRKIKPHIFAKGLSPSEAELAVCEELGIEVVREVGEQIHLHDLLYGS